MRYAIGLFFLLAASFPTTLAAAETGFHEYALSRKGDLRLSTYMTAHSVASIPADDPDASRCAAVLRKNGISKVCLEVYRGGFVVEKQTLIKVRDCLREQGFEVVGGIATVPGGDFGVHQEGPLGWFNWQNPKTREDITRVVRMAAEVFDEFIVDDFLCTGDVSAESKAAKGDRSWSDYRRELLVGLSTEVFIDPAKEVNPDIVMVIKYPQWYDRFHEFGYDVARQPALFDRVWVGTETRGSRTRRFGYVQPYEGFVNYRWIAALSLGKIGGAWFDHGDCDAHDLLDQAYQTVLAGAPEIILFNYADLAAGHGGHDLLRANFPRLADLAAAVREHPVVGVSAYKPPNSDAGGDLYIMDFLGMLGVPLVPAAEFDADAKAIFLPTQAAADREILAKVRRAVENGATIVMTTGFLHGAQGGEELARMAGIEWPFEKTPMRAAHVRDDGQPVKVTPELDLESLLKPSAAEVVLGALVDGRDVPFLTRRCAGRATLFVLNTHTYSQADFDAVGEVLLAPRALGILEIPRNWANTLRTAFTDTLGIRLDAPPRVTLQPLHDAGLVLGNHNLQEVEVELTSQRPLPEARDGFGESPVETANGALRIRLKGRGMAWIDGKETPLSR